MSNSALAAGLRNLRSKLAELQHNGDSDEQLLHAFLTRRDEDAFTVLVRRRGPMVLRVCWRVLGHEQDAEDAFQATFLVLSRQAARLRKKTSLAGRGGLAGVAERLRLIGKEVLTAFSNELRDAVTARTGGRCEYCQPSIFNHIADPE